MRARLSPSCERSTWGVERGVQEQSAEEDAWAKREEVTRGRRKFENELHILYPLSNITRDIKPRRKRWARHVARVCVCVTRNTYRMLNWGTLRETTWKT